MNEKKITFEGIEITPHSGLDTKHVALLRERFGANELTPPPRSPWWKDFLAKFKDPTIQILLVAAILSLAVAAVEKHWLGHSADAGYIDSIGIFIAVALATLVGFFSERRSAKEFEALNKVKDDISIKVLRDGQAAEIHIGEVVVGDIILLGLGDKIPADGILLEEMGLLVEESMLTGESVPASKSAFKQSLDLSRTEEYNVLSNPSFVARGTMVSDGHAVYCVTAVGDATQMGKIASALKDDPYKNETPLVAKLSVLARQISVVGASCAMIIFTIMSLSSLWKSSLCRVVSEGGAVSYPILTQIGPTNLGIFALISVACGGILLWLGVLPFFRSMELEIKSRFLKFCAFVPMFAVTFALCVACWGMMQEAQLTQEAGVDLLQEVLLSFIVAVTIIVVAVPEGLPMMVTVSLALNMMKMSREKCLVRKLEASETIGSATVICTDKTGTLTQNQMTPVWALLGRNEYTQKQMSALKKELTRTKLSQVWKSLLNGIAINSSADLHVETDAAGKTNIHGIGNPTECALLKFIHAQGEDYLELRNQSETTAEVAHNSQRKISLRIVKTKEGGEIGYMKGAPEKILERCKYFLVNGQQILLEEKDRVFISKKIQFASENALRVLAFCERNSSPSSPSNCLETTEDAAAWLEDRNYVLTGILGIADPVREEAAEAVQRCQYAGIKVKLITGDSLPTAKAIAKQTGILTRDDHFAAITSEDFNAISEEDLPKRAEEIQVIARSTPSDKLRLVKALHHSGEVVAMTGDGTNDAPALKFADVGVAMGITGTEVAKEASDIIIVDDNFKSIVTGVWWGRTLFQNIQRFLQFQLSVNAAALLCALIGPMVGVPIPLTVTQLLWINIIMDTFAAIAYSTDPPRETSLRVPPISRNAHIITPSMAVSIALVSIYQTAMLFAFLFNERLASFLLEPSAHYKVEGTPASNLPALTVFFTMLVMFQFWHKFNCRALTSKESCFALITRNRLFLWIIFVITAVQIAMVMSEPVGKFFRTTPLEWETLGKITLVTATVLPVGWLARQIAGLWEKTHEHV
ncbi:MAG: cation-translocating P-type ATPase [Planctomycetia bacterium]|nr:cation-translocating P-type ATPase [Planctomycetia bacterium]